MPGFIVRGKEVAYPGLVVKNWHDVPTYRLRIGVSAPDGYYCGPRTVKGVVHHTTKGIPGGTDQRPQIIKPGVGPNGGADACARWWSTSPAAAGAAIVNDRDRDCACLADLLSEVTYHAGSPNNGYTVGVEHYQDQDAGIWQSTIDDAVLIACAMSDIFDLPRQLHWPYLGHPVARLDKPGGADYRGHYGHRDCSSHRGFGDPGDFILQALINAGFEPFNVEKDEDLKAWRNRQAQLNAAGASPKLLVDGIPGPATYRAMRQTGLLFGGCIPTPFVI